ncbi:unnamed protein product [Rotaria sp. Silwood2]|nr:unnamed protein product [Rotaria sp. Silwood2]
MASTSSSTPKTGDAEFINTDGTSIETIHVKFNDSQMARCMPSLNAKMVQMPISKSSQNKLKEFVDKIKNIYQIILVKFIEGPNIVMLHIEFENTNDASVVRDLIKEKKKKLELTQQINEIEFV